MRYTITIDKQAHRQAAGDKEDEMARKRCTWKTIDTCKMYELQANEYEEHRVLMFGKVFRTFHGNNRFEDKTRFWNNIKTLNK